MQRKLTSIGLLIVVLGGIPTLGVGQNAAKSESRIEVAAKVGLHSITTLDVQREVKRALAGQEVPAGLRHYLEAQALQQLVDRRVLLDYFTGQDQAASKQEVDVAVQRLTEQQVRRKSTLAEYLRQAGLDEPALREQFAWRITWKKYLERYLTDENAQKYFRDHHRDFDGTQLQVAHILLKIDANQAESSRKELLARAKTIAADIAAKKLSFAEAAAKYSQAPTAAQGGDIGLIGRHDPMPESFSRAAYALEKGDVSEPVVTELGVHLITVLDVKPGQKTLKEVRAEVDVAVAQYSFQWLADRQRPMARVEFTGKSPYFAPDTGELVLP